MPLRFDKEPPWTIVVEITVTRPDGDHRGRATFPLASSPETTELTADDVADFNVISQMVAAEVASGVMNLVTHECSDDHGSGPDHLN